MVKILMLLITPWKWPNGTPTTSRTVCRGLDAWIVEIEIINIQSFTLLNWFKPVPGLYVCKELLTPSKSSSPTMPFLSVLLKELEQPFTQITPINPATGLPMEMELMVITS